MEVQTKLRTSALLVLFFATPSIAQESTRISAEPSANGFYTTYDVLEDHPDCNEHGHVAYSITADLRNIAFRAHDSQSRKSFDFGWPDHQAAAICTYIERRGVETMRFERPCAPNDASRKTPAWDGNPVQLDMTITLSSCLSPMGQFSLGGNWTATLRQSTGNTTLSGGIDPGEYATLVPSETVSHDGTFSTHLNPTGYTNNSIWLRDDALFADEDRNSITKDLATKPYFSMTLKCAPVKFEGMSGNTHYLDTAIMMFLTQEVEPQTCTGPDCPILDNQRWLSRSSTDCSE